MVDHVICPICRQQVAAGARHGTFDGEAFDCPTHGAFEVSKALMEEIAAGTDLDRAALEQGLTTARHNIAPSDVPMITTLEV